MEDGDIHGRKTLSQICRQVVEVGPLASIAQGHRLTRLETMQSIAALVVLTLMLQTKPSTRLWIRLTIAYRTCVYVLV